MKYHRPEPMSSDVSGHVGFSLEKLVYDNVLLFKMPQDSMTWVQWNIHMNRRQFLSYEVGGSDYFGFDQPFLQATTTSSAILELSDVILQVCVWERGVLGAVERKIPSLRSKPLSFIWY